MELKTHSTDEKLGKLAFVAPSAYPLGGVATWLDYLLPALNELGWKTELILTDGDYHDAQTYKRIHNIPTAKSVRCKSGTKEGRVRALYHILAEIAPDIVISVNIPDVLIATDRLKRNGMTIRSVMTLHAIQYDFFQDIKTYKDTLDWVICTNQLAKRLAVLEGSINDSQVLYAPYGVDISNTNYSIDLSKTEALRILYSGRLESFQKRTQDIPFIIKKLHQMNLDFEFIVAGSGPEEEALKAALSELDNIQYLGHVSHDTMINTIYPGCHALLLTSLWETGPIVIWEAMSAGLAVVSSNYIGSGLEGSLSHGSNCLLFPVGDTDSAASNIAKLANSDIRKKIILGGHELINNCYSKSTSINKWHSCFQEIYKALPGPLKNKKPFSTQSSGRLDRCLGTRVAENIRELFGLQFQHQSPGGEWPHSHNKVTDQSKFWRIAYEVDTSTIGRSHEFIESILRK